MRENWNPLFTAFLKTWLGRLANPTKEADAFSCKQLTRDGNVS